MDKSFFFFFFIHPPVQCTTHLSAKSGLATTRVSGKQERDSLTLRNLKANSRQALKYFPVQMMWKKLALCLPH